MDIIKDTLAALVTIGFSVIVVGICYDGLLNHTAEFLSGLLFFASCIVVAWVGVRIFSK